MFEHKGIAIPVWFDDMMVAEDAIRRAPKFRANAVSLVTHDYVSTAVPYIGTPIFSTYNTARADTVACAIRLAHRLGLRVLLKPHVDWTDGGWRGSFYMRDHDALREWKQQYMLMMHVYIDVAVREHVEALCIGTEFYDFNKDPAMADVWLTVIKAARAAGYQGQLTYAANWGWANDAEYNRPGLKGVWQQLDFVGVDAYFPLSKLANPSLLTLQNGWHWAENPWNEGYFQDHFTQLNSLHLTTGKPIVFTEIGYPCTDYAAKNPGGEVEAGWAFNDVLQANCFRAVFDTWKNVDWMHGAYFWQDGPEAEKDPPSSHAFWKRRAGAVLQYRYGEMS